MKELTGLVAGPPPDADGRGSLLLFPGYATAFDAEDLKALVANLEPVVAALGLASGVGASAQGFGVELQGRPWLLV